MGIGIVPILIEPDLELNRIAVLIGIDPDAGEVAVIPAIGEFRHRDVIQDVIRQDGKHLIDHLLGNEVILPTLKVGIIGHDGVIRDMSRADGAVNGFLVVAITSLGRHQIKGHLVVIDIDRQRPRLVGGKQ